MADSVTPAVRELVSQLRSDYGGDLERIASDMAPCQPCRTQKFETYLLLTVFRRAFVQAHARDASD